MSSPHELTTQYVFCSAAIMIVASVVFGGLARRVNQPTVVGEISGGILLGVVATAALNVSDIRQMIGADAALILGMLAQIGIVFLIFELATEFDFYKLRSQGLYKPAISISLIGFAGPFAVGVLAAYLYELERNQGEANIGFMLFCGLSFAISALPVLGRILAEKGLNTAEVGVITLTVAGFTDIFCWIILCVIEITVSDTRSGYADIGKNLLFFTALASVAAVATTVAKSKSRIISRVRERYFDNEATVAAFMLSIVLVFSAAASAVGVGALIGGFVLGMFFSGNHLVKTVWQEKISPFVYALLVPVFFTYTGTKIKLEDLTNRDELVWLFIWIVAAYSSKFIFTYIGARVGKLSHRDSLRIGVLLNTRGVVELIVLNIARDMDLITSSVFTALVIMALISTALTGPMLSWMEKSRFKQLKAEVGSQPI